MKLLTSKEEPEEQEESYSLSNDDAYKLLTLGHITEATSLEKFRAAAAQRQKEHDQRQKEMETRHAQGKEDMKGAIDTLAQRLNKEEVLDEVSVNTLQNYKQKASADAVHRATSGKGGSLDRFLNIQKAQDKIKQAKDKERSHVQQTSMSESNDHLLKDNKGKVRVFMLRRSAAKEAHQKGGVVYKQGNGYVIKLKESEDVTNANQPIQEQENRSSTRVSSSGITEERRSCSSTKDESCDCGCSGGETKETSSKGKITLGQILAKKKEAVKESIDKGIEPGLSMSTSGENLDRGSLKTKQIKKPLEELTGDETGASIGDQKEDELKKKGINLSTFKTKNYL